MEPDQKLKIAIVQYDICWEKPDENTRKVELLCRQVEEVDLILLPEMFTTGFSMNITEMAQTMNDSSVKWMKRFAMEKQSAVCGTLIIKDDGQYYNRLLFVYPDGEVQYYDKRHLFSMGNENQFYTPGTDRLIVQYKGFRILPLICYDLRFPVWSRNRNDYDLLVYSANWPAPRQKVWKTLLQARAIENQSFLAGINRVGTDATNIKYQGGSMFIDPKGKITKGAPDKMECVITETFSLSSLQTFRRKFPVLNDADLFTIQ